MKNCTGCKQEKEHSEFSVNRGNEDGLHLRCRKCSQLPKAIKSTHSYRDYITKAGLEDYTQKYLRIN